MNIEEAEQNWHVTDMDACFMLLACAGGLCWLGLVGFKAGLESVFNMLELYVIHKLSLRI